MNRSYSKKRHIQEANDRLEKRFINEDKQFYKSNLLLEKGAQEGSTDPYEHIMGVAAMSYWNPTGIKYNGNDNDIVYFYYYPYKEDGQALRYLKFNTTDNTVKWFNGCDLSKGGTIAPQQDGSLSGGWLLDKNGKMVNFTTALGFPSKHFADTGKEICDKYIIDDNNINKLTLNPNYKGSSSNTKSFTWDTTCDGSDSKPFKKGCKSNEIEKVQGCLNITQDGKFGSGTQSAIQGKIGKTTFTTADIDKLCGGTSTNIGVSGAQPPIAQTQKSAEEEIPTETQAQYRF